MLVELRNGTMQPRRFFTYVRRNDRNSTTARPIENRQSRELSIAGSREARRPITAPRISATAKAFVPHNYPSVTSHFHGPTSSRVAARETRFLPLSLLR